MKYSRILSPLLSFFLINSCSWVGNDPDEKRLSINLKARDIASGYEYSGSCSIQAGGWLQEAYSQSRKINSALELLRTDDDCTKLVTSVMDYNSVAFQGNPGDNKQFTKTAETKADQHDATTAIGPSILDSINGSSAGIGAVMIDNMLGSVHHHVTQKKLRIPNAEARNYVSNLLQQIPQNSKCLYNNPAQAKTIVMSAVNMAASFLSTPNSLLGEVNSSVNSFVEFIRQNRFAKSMKELKDANFRDSISCLLEATSVAYCKAYDAEKMLELVEKNQDKDVEQFEPLEGYYMMNREAKIVSDWLIKVMQGVRPKLIQDAEYKNKILDNITEFLQDVYNLEAQVENFRIDYREIKDYTAKKAFILETLLATVVKTIGGSFNRSSRGDVNFFSWTMQSLGIPFFLVGKVDASGNPIIPDEVAARGDRQFQMPWEKYMQTQGSGGGFIDVFDEPDALFDKIATQTKKIAEKAYIGANEYFRTRFIVDIPNLVAQAMSGQRITVRRALLNVKKYMERLYRQYKVNPEIPRSMLAYISETITKIDGVLAAFQKVDEVTYKKIKEFEEDLKKRLDQELNKTKKSKTLSYNDIKARIANIDDPDKIKTSIKKAISPTLGSMNEDIDAIATLGHNDEILQAFLDVIDTTYKNFNILLQRDTYLQTRVFTTVEFDFKQQLHDPSQLDNYVKQLFLVSANDIFADLLNASYGEDPTLLKQAINSAKEIHEKNLSVLENSFGNLFVGMITQYKAISEEQKYYGPSSYLRDSFTRKYNPTVGLLHPIINSTVFGDRFKYNTDIFELNPDVISDHDLSAETAADELSRLCLQSLAFKHINKFKKHCKNTILKSAQRGYFDDQNLSSMYNSYLNDYEKTLNEYIQATKWPAWMKGESKKQRRNKIKTYKRKLDRHYSKNVCAYRDFLRRNRVFQLLREFRR